ncbi:ABC transporter substrate-binding protein [Thiomicrorhabdus sp.]|uniref:ABC transporter substrate-binding protein n=1 Tax=Thiomicrorhabdus sp. TaxID=2039724 RepID=UPI0029C7CCEA|nr:ABC transporter substrate-binding protein [Thiomicrorhabdus sp.]
MSDTSVSRETDAPISLQLRWTPQFQFAGYYAALWQGYYRDAGLDVTIIPGSSQRQPNKEVLAGKAQYGVGNSEVLLSYLRGKPLVALAAIMQHSPSVLLTRKDSGIRTPQDLIGKKVMMYGGANDVEFLALLASEGVKPESLTILPSSFNINDLIDGKVDAFNAYLSNEPFYLWDKNIKPYVINPVEYGVDFYSDILFTRQDEVKKHPERVKAFLAASIKGWDYALNHQSEVIARLLKLPGIEKTRQQLLQEARILKKLIQPDQVPVGNINPGRFERMAYHLEEFGFVTDHHEINGFIFDPNPKISQSAFFKVLGLILAGLLLTIMIATWFWRINARLNSEIELRKQTEGSLEASRKHFQHIVENLQEVYYRTDLQGKVKYVSPSVQEKMHYSPQSVIGLNIESFYAPPFSRRDFLKALKANNGKIKNYELKAVNGQGREIWVATNSRYYYENGEVCGVEGTFREITQQKDHEVMMKTMAFEDPLTNLLNRRGLVKHLDQALRNCSMNGLYCVLLFIDLDNFKPVNDKHGHNIGDQLLQAVARRLRNAVRSSDLVFRLGGDEFVILLNDLGTADLHAAQDRTERIVDKLLKVLNDPFRVEELELTISASIGIKVFRDNVTNTDELIEQADQGLYVAKKEGKNRAHIV